MLEMLRCLKSKYFRPEPNNYCMINYKRAKMALYRSRDYKTSFESVGLSVQEKKFNTDFQHGSHHGFTIRTILATFVSTSHLNISNEISSQLAILFRRKNLNRKATWLLRQPSWISDQIDFSYFWSTSHRDTTYHVSSQWAFLFRSLK